MCSWFPFVQHHCSLPLLSSEPPPAFDTEQAVQLRQAVFMCTKYMGVAKGTLWNFSVVPLVVCLLLLTLEPESTSCGSSEGAAS